MRYKSTLKFKCSCGSEEKPLILKNYELACRKCKKKYSLTNGTIFHNLRFGLLKAMRIIQKEYANSFTTKSSQIAKEFKITLKSSRLFLRKTRANKKEVKKILELNYKISNALKKQNIIERRISEYYNQVINEESK